jgi:hypothetical protein
MFHIATPYSAVYYKYYSFFLNAREAACRGEQFLLRSARFSRPPHNRNTPPFWANVGVFMIALSSAMPHNFYTFLPDSEPQHGLTNIASKIDASY